jgi:hypothetical protein
MRNRIASLPSARCTAALRFLMLRAAAVERRAARKHPPADPRPLDERVRASGEW